MLLSRQVICMLCLLSVFKGYTGAVRIFQHPLRIRQPALRSTLLNLQPFCMNIGNVRTGGTRGAYSHFTHMIHSRMEAEPDHVQAMPRTAGKTDILVSGLGDVCILKNGLPGTDGAAWFLCLFAGQCLSNGFKQVALCGVWPRMDQRLG